MATNLGADAELAAIEGKTGSATGWSTLVTAFLKRYFGSSTTPFGDLSKLDSFGATPPGSISAFAGTAAPTGWLACDGASVSRTTYADLFAAIGTTWGSQSGTTFNVPDLRRRILLGAGGSVPAGTNGPANTVGSVDGDESIVLAAANLPAHSHAAGTLAAASAVAGTGPQRGKGASSDNDGQIRDINNVALPYIWPAADSGSSSYYKNLGPIDIPDHAHTISGATGETGAASSVPIMPPVAVVLPIIKT